jgi:hypothetical protein
MALCALLAMCFGASGTEQGGFGAPSAPEQVTNRAEVEHARRELGHRADFG